MGAFIIAGVVFVVTLAISVLTLFAASMSTTGTGGPNPLVPFTIGTVISALIVASHWMPHIGW